MELETNTGTCILQIDLINVALNRNLNIIELETNTGTCILQIDLINVAFEQKPKHHGTGNRHRYMYITNRFDKCSI